MVPPLEKHWLLPGVLFVAIFAGDLALNLIGIGFPITWHPDELSKALQIQTGDYNFFHPQLLLRLTILARQFLESDDALRPLVLAGRVVSATVTAAAVTLFGIVTARRFGISFGLISAALVGFTPTVFVNAHFFKEDSTLLLGCALVLLALQVVETSSKRRHSVLLGIAIGITCSAKYIGILMLIPTLAVVSMEQRTTVLVSATATFAIINFGGFLAPLSFINGIGVEIYHVASSHAGVRSGLLSTAAGVFFMRSTCSVFVLLWLGGLTYISCNVVSRRLGFTAVQVSRYEVALYLTPLVFLICIQMSMAVLPRYLMPASATVTVAAVWTLARIAARSRIARPIAAVLLCIGAAGTIESFTASASIFVDPPRLRFAKWIADNLPSNAKIAADFYSGIRDISGTEYDRTIIRLPQTVMIISPAPLDNDLSIENLRSAGFTHIVAAGGNYNRLFDPGRKVVSPAAERLKRYYEEVFENLKLVHEEPAGTDLDDLFASRMTVYEIQK